MNRVFVPAERPTLAEHELVRLTVASVIVSPAGAETIRLLRGQRIRLDSNLAKGSLQFPEFQPDGN